jgi:hypothetical protein
MRKFWIVLLSIGLIVAFTMPVSAADVKFSGSYIAQGYYENNRTVTDPEGSSVSNVWQRLRVQTVFQVQEGLTLTTRFDAMEKVWGAARSTTAGGTNSGSVSYENENLKFEHVYVTANLPFGRLMVGYQQQSVFGTQAFDSGDATYGPRVRYDYFYGPWQFLALWDKVEGAKDYSVTGPAGTPAETDKDANKYDVAFMYHGKQWDFGLLLITLWDSTTATPSATRPEGYKRTWFVFDPYVKATLGPVYFEAEAVYIMGKTRDYEETGKDQDKNSLSLYAKVQGNIGPAYVGLLGVYIQGDDNASDSKDKAGYPGGSDFNPCLILFNYDLTRWEGVQGGYTGTNGTGSEMRNVWLGQAFVGIKPIPKLDIKLAAAYAKADKTAPNWEDKDIGTEVDLTVSYKIFDNLEYMIGGGYLFAGDYYKGISQSNKVENDYLLTHKLTLTF